MTIEDIVVKFNTTPFLFVGSGMTRRYYNLPDWNGLLKHFAEMITPDEFAYNAYISKARSMHCSEGLLPKVAELIQKDFDDKWFSTPSIRTLSIEELLQVKNGIAPFKVEVSAYIKRNSILNENYREEIILLEKISEKSIAGVITTNYDQFLEQHISGFTRYVGQNQLIFSAIQGVGEIYKIHGSVDEPDSIIINEMDYKDFHEKSSYLAAKLMTIFVENPIIFMGYSISDSNIQRILKDIVNCLDESQFEVLEDRFVFVEYVEGMKGLNVSTYTIMIDGKPLNMRKVQLADYRILYEALNGKKSKLPVRLLRRFKEDLYSYVLTSTPTSTMRVAALEDQRVGDEEIVLNIGKLSDFGIKGLSGITSNDWYRDIILSDSNFTADEMLQHAFDKLLKHNSGKLPAFKYIAQAEGDYLEYVNQLNIRNFEDLMSRTIKKNRKCIGEYSSVDSIWQNEKMSLERATRLISHLKEEQIDINELESVLKEIFSNDINILENAGSASTHIKRLIRVYDYLKWGK